MPAVKISLRDFSESGSCCPFILHLILSQIMLFMLTVYHKITVYNYATTPYAGRINRKYLSLNSIEFVCQLVNFPRILPPDLSPWNVDSGFLYLTFCIRISIPGILHQDISTWNIASGDLDYSIRILLPGMLHQDLHTWNIASGDLVYYIRVYLPGILHQV